MSCECCHNEPSIGVGAVIGMPISIAWGRRCLDAHVVPYWLLVTNSACAGGGDYAPWWEETIARTLAYFGKTREGFDAEVLEERREMASDMAGGNPL